MSDTTVHATQGLEHAPATSRGERLHRVGEMVVQAVKDLFTDSGPQWAAAVAYYGLLSTFPLLLAAASIAAYFVEPHWAVEQATQLLGEFVPRGEGRVEAIVKDAVDARGSVSLLSIGALLWSGSRVFGAATKALNIAYDTDETYGFFKRTVVEVVMMATIGVIFVLALASRSIINIFWNALEFLPRGRDLAFQVTEATLPALLLLAAFFLIYRFVPRGQQDWRAALLGAAVATFLFLLARPVFLGYVQSFGEYNLIYGSLAIVVILALWAWLVALIMLFSGELASHTQEMLIEGRSADEVERRHQDRSPTRKGARYRPNAPQPGGDTPAESWGRPTERPSVMATLVIVAFLAGATFFRRWSRR